MTSIFSDEGPRISTVDDSSVIICVSIRKLGQGTISLRYSGERHGGYKSLIASASIGGVVEAI